MHAAEPFTIAALALSAVALLANILLWVPILGKALYLVGKVLRVFGFVVGLVDVWAILAWYHLIAPPF